MEAKQEVANPSQGILLQAWGLKKNYGDRSAVRGFDLQLRRGEIVALLGPNGAGKSTTVGMLAQLMAPDGGSCQLLGQEVRGDADPIKARLGLVTQDLALHEPLSAQANLRAFGGLYGLKGAVLAQRVEAALNLAGLSQRAHEAVSRFSGGMKRRLHIACALLHQPDVIILDEPTTGVDAQSRNAIFDMLLQLRDTGHALLYTTHYMEEAQRLCDRVLIMDAGRVLAQGTVAELSALLPAAERRHDGSTDLEQVFLHLTGRALRDCA
ncbi:ABC transporter ATP-binding protein [Roseateles sp. BYS180W]|uniref:ABC transporter ATP-binding protein n=1 Tax=Roseateles rivi TaxID=3299028 RepID=A0ABW7FXU4_9BURK